jgi:hypothetical protein
LRRIAATALVVLLASRTPAGAQEPDSGPLCLRTSFLDAVENGSAVQAKDILRRLTDREAPYTKLYIIDSESWCYTRKAGQVCPKAARLLIWRNRGQDLWFPIDPTSPEPVEQQLLDKARQLGSKLKISFERESTSDPTAYAEPRILLDNFSGQTCLPPGYTLGPEMGLESGVDNPLDVIAKPVADAEKAGREVADALKKLKEAEEREARCKGGETAQCPSLEERQAAQEQFEAQVKRLAEQTCAASASCGPDAPNKAQGEQGREKGDSGAEEGKEQAGSHNNPVKGSGGMLPAGAPPWLVDLLRMILAYFGIDQVVENAVLALYLIAPDMVNKLAAASAELSKDLDSDSLNQAFEAARQLYQLYNALKGMSADLNNLAKETDFKSVGKMVEAVAGRIDEMPDSLKKELQKSLQGDLANLAGALSNLDSLDLKDFEGVLQGDEAALDQLKRRIDKKAREHVQKTTERALAKEISRALNLPSGVAERALRSNSADFPNTLKRELIREGARQLNVDEGALTNLMMSKPALQTRAAQELVADQATRALNQTLQKNGITLQDMDDLRKTLAQPTPQAMQELFNERFPAQAALLKKAADAASDPKSLVATEAKRVLRDQLSNDLSPAALDALLAGKPAASVIESEMTARGLSGQAAIRETTRRIEAQLSAAVGEQVSLLPNELPGWLQKRLSEPLTDETMKDLVAETLVSIQATSNRVTEAAPLGAAFGVGCSATAKQAKLEDYGAVKDKLKTQVERIAGETSDALDAAGDITQFCHAAAPLIAAALTKLATTPAQIASEYGSAPLLAALSWKESLSKAKPAEAEVLRRFTGNINLSQIAGSSPEEAYGVLARIANERIQLDPSWSQSSAAALTRLTTNQELTQALYGGAKPDYPKAMKVLLAPMLVTGAPLAGWEQLLFGTSPAQRREAAYALITSHATTRPTGAQAIQSLRDAGACAQGATVVEIDANGVVTQVCSFEAVLDYLFDRASEGGRSVLVTKDIARELVQGRLTRGATLFVNRLICDKPERCDPARAVDQVKVGLEKQLAVAEVAGESLMGSLKTDQLKADLSEHKALIDTQIKAVTEQALQANWCGDSPAAELASCSGRGFACYSNKLEDAAVAALESCAVSEVPSLTQSLTHSVNVERLRKLLALKDCSRVMPSDQKDGALNIDAVIERCRSAAKL